MPQKNVYRNKPGIGTLDWIQSDIDDLSISDPPETGIKGGQVNSDAIDPGEKPMALVDFLWKHRND